MNTAAIPPPTRPHDRPAFRRAVALTLAAAVPITALAVHYLGAQPPAWYPPCLFHAATGLHCPGCGSARALHALMHGHLAAALGQNALLVLTLPLLLAWSVAAFARVVFQDRPAPGAPTGAARIVLIVVLVFWIARNVPVWPLTALAPG